MHHFALYYTTYIKPLNNQQPTIETINKEARINLAIQAIKSHDKLSCRRATRIYNILYSTLNRRLASKPTYSDNNIKHHRLILSEEDIIVRYILDLDIKGFLLTLSSIADIADYILIVRGERYIGKY
jgi:hypothetical protein